MGWYARGTLELHDVRDGCAQAPFWRLFWNLGVDSFRCVDTSWRSLRGPQRGFSAPLQGVIGLLSRVVSGSLKGSYRVAIWEYPSGN